jgi:hypothetical protein
MRDKTTVAMPKVSISSTGKMTSEISTDVTLAGRRDQTSTPDAS